MPTTTPHLLLLLLLLLLSAQFRFASVVVGVARDVHVTLLTQCVCCCC
jgi:hypothetical protein